MDKAHNVESVSLSGTTLRLRVDGKDWEIDLARHSDRLANATPEQRANFSSSFPTFQLGTHLLDKLCLPLPPEPAKPANARRSPRHFHAKSNCQPPDSSRPFFKKVASGAKRSFWTVLVPKFPFGNARSVRRTHLHRQALLTSSPEPTKSKKTIPDQIQSPIAKFIASTLQRIAR